MTTLTTEPRVAKTACGGTLSDPSPYPFAEFHGETIYFCTQACLDVFLKDPEPFMAGDVEHPLDESDPVESN